MSVYNAERFLRESIESILTQSYSDFEFIIIDDGSTDSSREFISRYAELDARVIPLYRERKGLTKSLNEAIDRARGTFIARQDADDISLPHRLSATLDFLEANRSISAAGSWCEKIDESGRNIGRLETPVDHDQICWAMIGYTAIAHPSVVIRRECIMQYGSYDEEYIHAQDYEMWTRWIRLGARFANIPECLIEYRFSSSQISAQFATSQWNSALRGATIYINYLLSKSLKPKQVVGIRQLIAPSTIGRDAIYGVPVLLRLLRLPRFKLCMGSAEARFVLATKIAGPLIKRLIKHIVGYR